MKILVVDDEPLARERLMRLLTDLRPQAELLEAGHGQQALEMVAAQQPELCLLDIRMPGMDGLEVAAALQNLDQPPAVIFCTAYDDYALEALDKEAVAYLLKPVRGEKLEQALERAGRLNRMQVASLNDASPMRSHITAETHKGVEMISVGEVRYFVAEQKYVRAVHTAGSLLIPDTLKDLEQEFTGMFLRVHRNCLVARRHVTGLVRDADEGWLVQLDGLDDQPQVSRRHVADIKSQLAS